jgi:hypothetical protein
MKKLLTTNIEKKYVYDNGDIVETRQIQLEGSNLKAFMDAALEYQTPEWKITQFNAYQRITPEGLDPLTSEDGSFTGNIYLRKETIAPQVAETIQS